MSLARRHRDQVLASLSAAVPLSEEGGLATIVTNGSPAAIAAAQMKLRLRHDLQRLKQIQSIQLKIAAKREMLPEYDAWVTGLLSADRPAPEDEVLPTIMVWRIDTGDYEGALDLADYVLHHDIALPTRYERTAPALIVEEIADQALKAQGAGAEFPLAILERVEMLAAGRDMHDPIRAKLAKAIGVELARRAEGLDPAGTAFPSAAADALHKLREAQELNDRVGAKDRIKRLEKALAKAVAPAATEQAGTTPAA